MQICLYFLYQKINFLQARGEEQSIGDAGMPATPRPEDLAVMEQLKREKEDVEKELHDQHQVTGDRFGLL